MIQKSQGDRKGKTISPQADLINYDFQNSVAPLSPSPSKGEGGGEVDKLEFLEGLANLPNSSLKRCFQFPSSRALDIMIVFLLSGFFPLTLYISPVGRGENGDVE